MEVLHYDCIWPMRNAGRLLFFTFLVWMDLFCLEEEEEVRIHFFFFLKWKLQFS